MHDPNFYRFDCSTRVTDGRTDARAIAIYDIYVDSMATRAGVQACIIIVAQAFISICVSSIAFCTLHSHIALCVSIFVLLYYLQQVAYAFSGSLPCLVTFIL